MKKMEPSGIDMRYTGAEKEKIQTKPKINKGNRNQQSLK